MERVQQQAGNRNRAGCMPHCKAVARHARGSSDKSNKKNVPAICRNLRIMVKTQQEGRLVSNPDNHKAFENPTAAQARHYSRTVLPAASR